ncbi:MAG: 5-oxoprolinase subunit PxpA, partial [Pyrinomonadaceae bacterium]
YISSANIACGFHAGDEATMRRTIELALENNVAIGAHPSFPDRENFGRTTLTLPPKAVFDIVTEQIRTLAEIAALQAAKLSHVKPHGALYNQSAKDIELAAAIADAVCTFDPNLILFGLSESVSISEAKRVGLRTASETFADRTYSSNGSLTPRSQPNALIDSEYRAVEQVLQMIESGTVTATDGSTVNIECDTICIHGDGEHAVVFAQRIHSELTKRGIALRQPK